MNRTILNFLVTLVLAIILGVFLPWWSIMIASFIAAIFIPLKKAMVFIIPFLAIGIYWMVYSFILTQANDYILSKKIAILFSLGENWFLVLLITGFIGGIAAGISAIFGKQLRVVLG